MAEAALPQDVAPAKRSKLPLLIGLGLFLLGGGGGFYALYSGLILGGGEAATEGHETPEGAAGVAFVAVDPLVVSIGDASVQRHLKLTTSLEVQAGTEEAVTALLPRILDVLNGYLRAVDPKDLEDPSALVRLRAQLLRRIQLVTGDGRVRDLLVTEFVLN